MALVGPVFLDTSVLLAGLIELSGPDAPAQRVLRAVADRAIADPRTAWHCCLEFYSVATRLPEEYRLTPHDALRLVEEEILGRFEVLELPASSRVEFLAHAVADRIAGGRIYDFHIATVAHAAGCHVLVTDNRRHFAPLLRSGVRVLTAAEAADEV